MIMKRTDTQTGNAIWRLRPPARYLTPKAAARLAAGMLAMLGLASVANAGGPLRLPTGYNAGRFSYGNGTCEPNSSNEDPLNVVFYGTTGPIQIDDAAIKVILKYGHGSDNNSKYMDNEGGGRSWFRDYIVPHSMGFRCHEANPDQLGTGNDVADRNHVRLFQQAAADCSRQPYLDMEPTHGLAVCRAETSLDAHMDSNVLNSSCSPPATHISSSYDAPQRALANSVYAPTNSAGRHLYVVHYVHRGRSFHKHMCNGDNTPYNSEQRWIHLPYSATH